MWSAESASCRRPKAPETKRTRRNAPSFFDYCFRRDLLELGVVEFFPVVDVIQVDGAGVDAAVIGQSARTQDARRVSSSWMYPRIDWLSL